MIHSDDEVEGSWASNCSLRKAIDDVTSGRYDDDLPPVASFSKSRLQLPLMSSTLVTTDRQERGYRILFLLNVGGKPSQSYDGFV